MSVPDPLRKLALLIENDLDALGWDQPHRLFTVSGTHSDPFLTPLLTFSVASDLAAIAPDTIPADAIGLVMVVEGYKTPPPPDDEIDAWLAQTDAFLAATGLADDDDIAARRAALTREQIVTRYLALANSSQRPQDFPGARELRVALLVLRDGGAVGVQRYRGGEPVLSDVDAAADNGPLFDMLRRLLGVPGSSAALNSRILGAQPGVDLSSGKPHVTVAWGDMRGELSPEMTRQLALDLMHVATLAESDAIYWHFLTVEAKLDAHMARAALSSLVQHRAVMDAREVVNLPDGESAHADAPDASDASDAPEGGKDPRP